MAKQTMLEVLDEHFKDVKFDAALCKRIIEYSIRFMNRNEDHSAFFGGVLMGVNPVYFYDTDRELWFEDVLGVDEDMLQYDFQRAEGVDPKNQKVASDVMNYTPGYITQRLMKATNIPLKTVHEACRHAFQVLHYKYITSLLVRRFKYPARREVMEATFAQLNYKFDIKTIGSWGKLVKDRAEGIIDPNSIYGPLLHDKPGVDEEYWMRRVVTDTQTRIRELINKYYGMYITVLNSGVTIRTTSDMMVTDAGEMVLRDKTSGYRSYISYAHLICTSKENLIKSELLSVISSAMHTAPEPMLISSLEFIARNFNQPRSKDLTKFVDECLLYTFEYMQSIKTSVQRQNDLKDLVTRLRLLVMAPKTSDVRVLTIRDMGDAIVKNATNSRHAGQIAAVRTALYLYISLRTLCKSYYTK
ncbi:hypothetical protein ST201phi2-1p036 [Pseudomonas phage 201phi2-1]|uniref:Uncharacterized protein n=1 Tax=Pseudomonas phage 201phi2-1 TaxID=198110 RepID=B3FK11_BP201|nr:hypothetical protein ST201phi2-1p036 [Pseudomonas phage 201phi2-1]ABY62869.1 hypothetical protein 201phi2-1p036 [Pseudomonas phage 201phi2-1]